MNIKQNTTNPKQMSNCQVTQWIYKKNCFESKKPDKDLALEWQFTAQCEVIT